MTPRGVLAFCREKEVKAIDIRFTDLLGTWHHITIPVNQLNESSFDQGFGIDATNLRCSEGGDRLVIPQTTSAFLDPFATIPTLILLGSLQTPVTRDDDALDPRVIAERALNYLQGTGLATRAVFGPECEFFLFRDARYSLSPWTSSISLVSDEAPWSSSSSERRSPNLVIRSGEGYSPCPPIDQSFDLRNEIMESLIDADIAVSMHHHGLASCGQCEIDIVARDIVPAADALMTLKYIVRNVARKHGQLATFMPKPIESDRGSAMHTHFSLWRGEEPLFAGQAYGGLSEMALLAIGGILRHAPALSAICNPSTNSYKRLHHPAFQPLLLSYCQHSKGVLCRIPSYSNNPKTKRVEIRSPDPSANPYLAFSAILMAAIDGIQNKIHPGNPYDAKSVQSSGSRSDNGFGSHSAKRNVLPRSLWHALECLEQDHEFLMRGDVFTREMLETWSAHKWQVERLATESHPTPAEFQQYFDC